MANNILIITSQTYPSAAGDGRSAFFLAQELYKQGGKCDILTLETEEEQIINHDYNLLNPSIIKIAYHDKTLAGKIATRIHLFFFLIIHIKRYNTWLIYGKTLGNRIALILGKTTRKKTIFRPTLWEYDDLRTLTKDSLFNKYTYRLSTGFWSLNPSITETILKIGIERNRIFESPQGVRAIFSPPQLGEKEKLRKKLNIPNDKTIITMVGHVIKRKGFPAIFNLFEGIDNFYLIVVGTNNPSPSERLFSYYEEMQAITNIGQRLIGSNIQFTGKVEDVSEYLKASDIFLHASTREGFPPNSLNEAMSVGLPCLVKKIVGIPQRDYSNVIMVYNNEKDFKANINLLIRNNQQRNELSLNAADFSRRHLDLKIIANNLVAFINSI
ncbi:MAG TPA: glycosyltransferase family 4 protein [Williamwhitmania sp.]|nr:glycosyltransferase family 4 protein [Williamwhitmania sp.]